MPFSKSCPKCGGSIQCERRPGEASAYACQSCSWSLAALSPVVGQPRERRKVLRLVRNSWDHLPPAA
jgi:reverse gyrase